MNIGARLAPAGTAVWQVAVERNRLSGATMCKPLPPEPCLGMAAMGGGPALQQAEGARRPPVRPRPPAHRRRVPGTWAGACHLPPLPSLRCQSDAQPLRALSCDA